jgi:hypothetical protein
MADYEPARLLRKHKKENKQMTTSKARMVPPLVAALIVATASVNATSQVETRNQRNLVRLSEVGLIRNSGELDSHVAFYGWTDSGVVRVLDNGAVDQAFWDSGRSEGRVIRQEIVGLSPTLLAGPHTAPTILPAFGGAVSPTPVHGCSHVILGTTFDGAEVRLQMKESRPEIIFTCPYGSRPAATEVIIAGLDGFVLCGDGTLRASAPEGDYVLSAPVGWDVDSGGSAAVGYRTIAGGYSFTVAEGYQDGGLVIDPVLSATFIGGSSYDSSMGLDQAADGSVVVSGSTLSANFPLTVGPFGSGGGTDGFVARFAADLSAPTAIAVFGGNGLDAPWDLDVHQTTGVVTVVGSTSSTSLPGNPLIGYAGGGDGFAMKFPLSLNAIQASTYIGGPGSDALFAVDGNFTAGWYTDGGLGAGAYIASLGSNLSLVSQAIVNTANPNIELFTDVLVTGSGVYAVGNVAQSAAVYKLSGTLSQQASSVLDFGAVGSGVDEYSAVELNPITGEIVAAGGFDGQAAAMVARYNANSLALIEAVQLSGSGDDSCTALTVKPDGELVVAGYTSSPNFPVTIHADKSNLSSASGTDAFLARLSPTLDLKYSTYYGNATGEDIPRALSATSTGQVLLFASVGGLGYGVAPGWDATHNGGGDAYIAKIGFNALSAANGVTTASIASQGTQLLVLDPGQAKAGAVYAILGTASGIAPGLVVDGITIPLQYDSYFAFLLSAPNVVVTPGIGTLDMNGQRVATFKVPAGVASSLAGLQLHHAFVLLTGGLVSFASNAVGVTLLP